MKKYHIVKYRDSGEQIIFEERSNIKNNFSSLSAGFDSEKELREHNEVLEEDCKICNGIVSTHYIEPTRTILKEKNLCFNCNFWQDKLDRLLSGDHRVFVIGGTMYYHSNDDRDPVRTFRGFGGRKFMIQRLDGEILETNNLWCNGEVPKDFKDKIKDNARFINNGD